MSRGVSLKIGTRGIDAIVDARPHEVVWPDEHCAAPPSTGSRSLLAGNDDTIHLTQLMQHPREPAMEKQSLEIDMRKPPRTLPGRAVPSGHKRSGKCAHSERCGLLRQQSTPKSDRRHDRMEASSSGDRSPSIGISHFASAHA